MVAFVLHTGTNGLGVVRSLGREAIPAVGVDSRASQRSRAFGQLNTGEKGMFRRALQAAKARGKISNLRLMVHV